MLQGQSVSDLRVALLSQVTGRQAGLANCILTTPQRYLAGQRHCYTKTDVWAKPDVQKHVLQAPKFTAFGDLCTSAKAS